MEELFKAIAVAITSAFKHTLVGIPAGYVAGFNYLEVVLYTFIGGTLGIIFFVYSARGVKNLYVKYLESRNKKPRKFTKMNRFIVKIKQRFGLYGLALITPPIISVPVGAMIAASIYRDKKRVLVFMIGGVVFWSFLGAAIVEPIQQLYQFIAGK